MYNNAKDILLYDDNYIDLSERSDEVDIKNNMKEAREIVSALKHTMQKNDIKILAAPQIGFKKRIFCIAFEEEIKTFINPIIMEAKDIQLSKETDVTLPNKIFIRPRNSEVHVMYQRPTGQSEARQFLGMASILFQQGMDAIDGISLVDIGLEIDDDFENASDDEKMEVITMYLDSLDMKHKEIQKQIQEDPELNSFQKGIDFMTSVNKGETKLEYE